jgi:hypothetical protein
MNYDQKNLDGITTLAYTHGVLYTAKPFAYCPWCSKKLIDKEVSGKEAFLKHIAEIEKNSKFFSLAESEKALGLLGKQGE